MEALTPLRVSLARFLEWQLAMDRSPRTVEAKENALNHFIDWSEERGLDNPNLITRPILERYRRYLYHYRKADGQPLSLSTQRNRLTPLKVFFRWLVKENHLLHNPASELDLPRPHKRLPRGILSQQEVEAVLNQTLQHDDEALGLRDRAILETFYATGIRRMELANLKLDDVDVEQQTVMVREGKGKKDRLLPIGERACLWIDKYLLEVRPTLVIEPDSNHLFIHHTGTAFNPHQLSHLVKKYLMAAEINKPGACHLFRHTMATLMLENGADIRFIQAMLGHADIATTQIYTHVSIQKLREVYGRTHPAKMERQHSINSNSDEEMLTETDLFNALEAEWEEETLESGKRV